MSHRLVCLFAILAGACGAQPTVPPATAGSNAPRVAAPSTPGVATLSLDKRFGENGYAALDLGEFEMQLHDVLALPDGSILAAGHGPFPDLQMAVVKLTPAGVLDRSFAGGAGATKVGTQGAFGKTLAVDARGRILVAGYYYGPNAEQQNVALGRVLPDGSIDTAFGTNGVVTLDLSKSDDRPSGVFALPNGQILVVGMHSQPNHAYDTFVARLDDSGALDASYGTNGVAYYDPVPGHEFTTRAVLDPTDNSIVISGYIVGSKRGGFVARVLPDGKGDPTFGTNGSLVIDSEISSAWASTVDPVTRAVYFGGQLKSDRGFVMRVTRDGVLDPTWGKAGVALGPRASDQYYALLLPAGGGVIGIGFRDSSSDSRPMLARWTARGALERSFGSNGVLLAPYEGDFLFGAAFDAKGGVIAVGTTSPESRILGLVMRFAAPR